MLSTGPATSATAEPALHCGNSGRNTLFDRSATNMRRYLFMIFPVVDRKLRISGPGCCCLEKFAITIAGFAFSSSALYYKDLTMYSTSLQFLIPFLLLLPLAFVCCVYNRIRLSGTLSAGKSFSLDRTRLCSLSRPIIKPSVLLPMLAQQTLCPAFVLYPETLGGDFVPGDREYSCLPSFLAVVVGRFFPVAVVFGD